MEAQILLKNPEVFPSDEVLQNTLGNTIYDVLESFLRTIAGEEYGLTIEWRFF